MRKRSFIHGFAAGVVVKVLCTVVFTLALAAVFHIGSAAQESGFGRDGRFPAFSGAWCAARILVLIGAVAAGAASSHWSRPGAWAAPLALAFVWLVWSVVKVDAGQPLSAIVIWVSVSPIGILLGALLYRRLGRTSDV